MEKIVHKGKVSEQPVNGIQYIYLDMPHNPDSAILSFGIDAFLPLQEIFKPYLGKDISITIEKDEGKVRNITIHEE